VLYFSSLSSINFHEKRAPNDNGAGKSVLCFDNSGIQLSALNHVFGHVRINISTEPFGLMLSLAVSSTFIVQLCKSIPSGQEEYKDQSAYISVCVFIRFSSELCSKNIVNDFHIFTDLYKNYI
jgi:hypothetical protein